MHSSLSKLSISKIISPSQTAQIKMRSLTIDPLIQLHLLPRFGAKRTRKSASIRAARSDESQATRDEKQQLNLSVLRFTFGIPGLDESYLPRWIGYGFGSLLLLNHFLGSDSAATPAQLRTEALGLALAAFSVALPYFGRFLKGANPVDQATLPQGAKQIFVMSQNVSDGEKEDLAWATYVLLRNTNTVAVSITIEGELCVRGYWNIPDNVSRAQVLDWFEGQIENIGLSGLKDTLYFPQATESGLWKILPSGTRSILVEPVLHAADGNANVEETKGFILLASSMGYAYGDKDIAWIKAVANKFRGHHRIII